MQTRTPTRSGSFVPTPVSVRSRIILAFTVVTVLLLAVIAGATWLAREHQDALAQADRHSRQSELLAQARSATTTQLTMTLLYVATGDESFLNDLTTTQQQTLRAVTEYLDLAEQAGEEEEIEILQKMIAASLPMTAAWDEAITARREGDTETAIALVAGSQPAMEEITAAGDALSAQEAEEVAALRSEASTTAGIAFWMLLASGVVGLTTAVAAAYFITRSVLRPISSLQTAAQSVSGGDLEARAPEDGPRELAAVGTAFNEMTEALLDASKRRELEEERERSHRELAEAHSRLEETTSRLNGVLASIDDVIYAVTPNTLQVLYMNESVNALYGRSASEFRENGALWTEVAHADDRDRAAALYPTVRDHGYAQDEYRIVRPDGEIRWVRARMRLVTNEQGIPVRIDGMNTDITELKRTEHEREQAYAELAKAHDELGEASERLDGIVSSIQDVVYSVSADVSRVIYVNAAAETVYGRSVSEFTQDPAIWLEMIHPEDRERAHRLLAEIAKTGRIDGEYRIMRPDGAIRWVYTRSRLIRDAKGKPLRIDGTSTDITQRKLAEEAVRASEERFRALIQNAQDIITVLNPDGTIEFESPSLRSILGYPPEELIGKRAFDYIHPDDTNEAAQKIAAGLQNPGEPQTAQFRFRHKDGSWRYLESVGSAMETDSGVTIIVNSRDVTARKEAEELIAHMAYHDALTGLPNRLYLQDFANVALAQADRSGAMVGVLSIDLDYLKRVNDTFGHPSGDELLKSAAERLNASVREGDTVARVGGDEFLAIVSQCSSAEDAEAAASRIVEAFRKPFLVSGAECKVTASIGLSVFPADSQDLKELIKNADAAMYRAKKQGRDGYRVYSPELDGQERTGDIAEPAATGASDRS